MELNSPSENATGDSQSPCSFRVFFPTHDAKLGYEKDKTTEIQPGWDHFSRITRPGGRGRWPSWLTVQPLSESSWWLWLQRLSHPHGFYSCSHQSPFPLSSPLQSVAWCRCRDLSPRLLATMFCLVFSRVTFMLTWLHEILQLLLWDEPNQSIALLGNRPCEALSTTSWCLIYYVLKTLQLTIHELPVRWQHVCTPAQSIAGSEQSRLPWLCLCSNSRHNWGNLAAAAILFVWWSTVHRVANSRHDWGNLAAAAILFIERPDISTKKKKLLKLINELVKLEDTKLIYRNLLTFALLLYSNYFGVSGKINQARQK